MTGESVTPSGDGTSSAASPQLRRNATLLGEVAWLMLRVDARRGWRVLDFARMVVPALAQRQFRIYYDGGVPIAFVTWVLLSAEAEARFIADPTALRPEDWMSGDNAYLVDIVASEGAIAKITPLLRRDPLLQVRRLRALRRRNGVIKTIEISPRPHGLPRIAARHSSPAGQESKAATTDACSALSVA